MENVKVDKAKLIERLKSNREKHAEAFEVACTDYREAAVCLLAKELDKLNQVHDNLDAGKTVELPTVFFEIELPISYVKDYDLALEMLEDSVESEITLTKKEYRQLWKDDWEWKQREMTKSIFYASNKG